MLHIVGAAMIALFTLTPRPAAVAVMHDEFGFVGTLTAVDLAKDRVTLRYKDNGKDEVVKLFLTAKTEVVDKDKKTIPRASLKNGLTAVVTAYGDDGDEELEALLIRIVPALASK